MRNLVISSALALLLAAPSQAAEIIGTVVTNDPTDETIVLRLADGRSMTIRTSETTQIQKGNAVVKTTTLMQGTPVQVVTQDAVTGETVVTPTATRIVVVPAAPAEEDDDVDVDIDTDDD